MLDTAEDRRQRKLEYQRAYRRQNKDKRRDERRAYRNLHGTTGHLYSVERGVARKAEYEARLKEVPPDTRSLTARLLGDPLPNDTRRQRYGNGHVCIVDDD